MMRKAISENSDIEKRAGHRGGDLTIAACRRLVGVMDCQRLPA